MREAAEPSGLNSEPVLVPPLPQSLPPSLPVLFQVTFHFLLLPPSRWPLGASVLCLKGAPKFHPWVPW